MKRLTVDIPKQELNDDFSIVHDDEETLLKHNNQYIMSDRESETHEHIPFFNQPLRGKILVTGLGVGLINEYLITIPEIERVVIVEKYKEVIEMVWPHCKRDERFEVVHADAETWEPTMHFDYAWLDHWTEHFDMKREDWWESVYEKYKPHAVVAMIWKPTHLMD